MPQLQKPKGFRSAASALVMGRAAKRLGVKSGDLSLARAGHNLVAAIMAGEIAEAVGCTQKTISVLLAPFIENGQVSETDKTDRSAELAAIAVDDDQLQPTLL